MSVDDVTIQAIGMIMSTVHRKTLVTRQEYDELMRAAVDLYRENNALRKSLTGLEQLASSWTGTPENSAAIVAARLLLREAR